MMFLWAVIKATLVLAGGVAALLLLKRSTAAARAMTCLLSLAGAIVAAVWTLWPAAPSIPLEVPAARFMVRAGATGQSLADAAGIAAPAIALLWALGAALVVIRILAGEMMVRRAIAGSVQLHPASAWRRLAPRLDIRAAAIPTPLVCRIWNPVLLVPAEMAEWTEDRCRAILLHELAHLRRRDLASNAFSAAATALLWFHPLAWVLAARLRREQELACDDAVLSRGVAAHAYAELLLHSASQMTARPRFGCAMAAPAAALRTRMAHVLDPRRPRQLARRSAAALSAVFLVAILLVGTVRPAFADRIYRIGKDVTAPKLIHKVEPQYTEEARTAKVQGTAVLHVIIGPDGRARTVTVTRSLDKGLDEKAIEAIRQWRFEPGKRKGKPVTVQAQVEVNFRLQ